MIQNKINFQVLNDPGGQILVLEREREGPNKKIFSFYFEAEINC